MSSQKNDRVSKSRVELIATEEEDYGIGTGLIDRFSIFDSQLIWKAM
jgi:hypothetical protein